MVALLQNADDDLPISLRMVRAKRVASVSLPYPLAAAHISYSAIDNRFPESDALAYCAFHDMLLIAPAVQDVTHKTTASDSDLMVG